MYIQLVLISICLFIFTARSLKSPIIDNFIINLGLPKSGTTSFHDGVMRLGVKSLHQELLKLNTKRKFCGDNIFPIKSTIVGGNTTVALKWQKIKNSKSCTIGMLIQNYLTLNERPFDRFIADGYRSFAQLDVCFMGNKICIIPQLDALENIVNAYPNAYYVHTKRSSAERHVASIDAWFNMLDRFNTGGLLKRFKGQSPNNTKQENGIIMINEIHQQTLLFFSRRPQVKFLDVCIEDKDANKTIAAFLNITHFNLEQLRKGRYNHSHILTQSKLPSPSSTTI